MEYSKIHEIVILKNNSKPGSGSEFFFEYLKIKYNLNSQINHAYHFFKRYPMAIPLEENQLLHFKLIYDFFFEKDLVGDVPLLIKGFYTDADDQIIESQIKDDKLQKLKEHFENIEKKVN